MSQWKESTSTRRMAGTVSDTGDTSSKWQQAQRKEKYNDSERPVSSFDRCHPYRRTTKSSLLNLHMLLSTCFRTWIEAGVDSKDYVGPGTVQRAKKKSKKS